jgi:hypothetical protein
MKWRNEKMVWFCRAEGLSEMLVPLINWYKCGLLMSAASGMAYTFSNYVIIFSWSLVL